MWVPTTDVQATLHGASCQECLYRYAPPPGCAHRSRFAGILKNETEEARAELRNLLLRQSNILVSSQYRGNACQGPHAAVICIALQTVLLRCRVAKQVSLRLQSSVTIITYEKRISTPFTVK